MKRFFWMYLYPGGAVFLAIFALSFGAPETATLTPLWQAVGLFVFVVGIYCGIHYRRARLVFLLLLFMAFAGAVQFMPAGEPTLFVLLVSSIALPFNFAWIARMKEQRSLASIVAPLFIATMAAEVAGLIWLGRTYMTETVSVLSREWLALPWAIPDVLTQAGWVAMLLCGMAVVWRAVIKPSTFEGTLCWSYIAMALALVRPEEAAFWFTGAALASTLGTLTARHFVSYSDEVTGLPGKKALYEYLGKLSSSYTLVVAEVDNLQEINSVHGRKVGDQVLRMMANRFYKFHYGGRLFRNEGKTFTMVFPGKRPSLLLPALDMLRSSIASRTFLLRRPGRPRKRPEEPVQNKQKPGELQITASFGVVENLTDIKEADRILSAANKRLERAKKLGRNRVCA